MRIQMNERKIGREMEKRLNVCKWVRVRKKIMFVSK